MATAPTYCTHRQLKDVFPQVDSFDTKRSIYGWVLGFEDFGGASNVNIYYAYNTGLITQLFQDGVRMTNLTTNVTAEKTQIATEVDEAATALVVDSSSGFSQYDILKVDKEYIQASADPVGTSIGASGTRGKFGTHQRTHLVDRSVYLVVDESELDNTNNNWFFYDSELDLTVACFQNDLNPNDLNMEAGEEFDTLITRVTANASRYLDAKLDPNLPKEQLKDKEGNFDYIIVRTSALIAATFLIRSHDPTSEVATALMEDAQGNIDSLNSGGAALSWQTTGDSSKGVIRDVSYTKSAIRPVDTRGRWSGSWDLLKVKITTGGALGTAKYSAWSKSGDKLKDNKIVTDEVITGDFQQLASNLQIRFGGSTDSSAATVDDEWEIEVSGWAEEVDNSSVNSVKMTRGGLGIRRFGKY